MKKITAILLAVLMIAAVFASCNFGTGDVTTGDPAQTEDPAGETTTGGSEGETTPGGDTTTTQSNGEEEAPFKPENATVLEIIKNKKANAKIIYPEGDRVAADAADELRQLIRSELGVSFRAVSDKDVEADSEVVEILVGYTNRPESEDIRKFIGYRDYGIFVSGNKLIVAGWFEDAYTKVLTKFKSLYLSEEVTDLSVSSDNNYATTAHYQLNGMFSKGDNARKLAGNFYYKYQIVVPEQYTVTEHRFAQRLQALLGTKVGAVLNIVTDKDPASDYEILVGKTARTNSDVGDLKYIVNVKGNSVEMLSDSFYGYDYLFEYCEKSFVSDINKVKADSGVLQDTSYVSMLKDDGSSSFASKSGELRIIFNNVFGFDLMSTTPNGSCMPGIRNPMIAEFYSDFDADILCFEEITGTMRGTMPVTTLLEKYGYKEVPAGTCTTPIMYRESTIELVEGGDKNFAAYLYPSKVQYPIQGDKYMTWAVFKVKETGEKFGVINVHMDSFDTHGEGSGAAKAAAEVQLMMETANDIFSKHGCAVLMGGDFNTTVGEPTHNTLVYEGGYTDIQTIAKITDNNKGYFHGVNYMTYTEGLSGAYFTGQAQTDLNYSLSVDHIYASSYAKSALEFNRFDILSDASVSSFADHCAMVLDFSFK